MSVVEEAVDGQTVKVVKLKTKGRDVTIGMASTVEVALSSAESRVRDMGGDKVNRIINQPC